MAGLQPRKMKIGLARFDIVLDSCVPHNEFVEIIAIIEGYRGVERVTAPRFSRLITVEVKTSDLHRIEAIIGSIRDMLYGRNMGDRPVPSH